MKITSQWVSGRCFVATNESGHSVLSDGAAADEGKRAPSPMELLLMGVAGCSGIDVVEILQKQRQNIDDCLATVTAVRADNVPKVFTEIHIHFKVIGKDLKEEAVARAVQLSAEKYCSASIMLGKAARISHSFEVAES
ncbi:OsmC family protein [Conchiformibius steedae]|uniref:OsmC family protein n=1 Tax=Conchiformibius steedae TaxID=153493 RepID=A0A3P2A2R6_9NEIS|nr:OsmC family protein [Conchiformibius steedae]RRD89619.1 OsmC family protein [Conchiformibius steedae]